MAYYFRRRSRRSELSRYQSMYQTRQARHGRFRSGLVFLVPIGPNRWHLYPFESIHDGDTLRFLLDQLGFRDMFHHSKPELREWVPIEPLRLFRLEHEVECSRFDLDLFGQHRWFVQLRQRILDYWSDYPQMMLYLIY